MLTGNRIIMDIPRFTYEYTHCLMIDYTLMTQAKGHFTLKVKLLSNKQQEEVNVCSRSYTIGL